MSDRNLARLASRALAGLARAGSSMTNGSGDYVISFSTEEAIYNPMLMAVIVKGYDSRTGEVRVIKVLPVNSAKAIYRKHSGEVN